MSLSYGGTSGVFFIVNQIRLQIHLNAISQSDRSMYLRARLHLRLAGPGRFETMLDRSQGKLLKNPLCPDMSKTYLR